MPMRMPCPERCAGETGVSLETGGGVTCSKADQEEKSLKSVT